MGQSWFRYNITQSFGQNGEKGVDLGTPFHTPITALFAGTVRQSGRTQWSCGSSGGQVTIVTNIPGYGVLTSYYLHLDTANVAVGDAVAVGQVIGLSGGQTNGGNWPVENCPQRGIIYSTGPHTEFGFNAPWVSGPGSNIDPTWAIQAARNGTLPITSTDGSTSLPTQTLGDGGSNTGNGTANVPSFTVDANALEKGLLQFYDLSSKTNRVITQPSGFDGICEAIDEAEQLAVWNWFNPLGSMVADFKPLVIRGTIMLVCMLVIIKVVWEWIHTPVEFASRGIGMLVAPEAAPVIAASSLEQAPSSVAR